MKLIIGLGNPGENYDHTRHNAGFAAIDFFRQNSNGFSEWQNSAKFKAEISEGEIDGPPSSENFGRASQKIILAKPQTLMNLSGQASRLLKDFYKMEISDIIVIHDDLDLALGQLRLSQNSGSAGHKGVQSIIASLSSQNFGRIRLGIKPTSASPLYKGGLGGIFSKLFPKTPPEKFVLQKFSEEEMKIINDVIEKSNQVLKTIITENFPSAMNKFN